MFLLRYVLPMNESTFGQLSFADPWVTYLLRHWMYFHMSFKIQSCESTVKMAGVYKRIAVKVADPHP